MRTLFIAGMLCALAGVAGAETGGDISITPAQRETLGIQSASLQSAGGSFGQPLPAEVVIPPSQQHVVSAPLTGLVAHQHVAIGDQVRKGDALASLKSPEFLALQREYLQAYTQADLAKSQFDRDTTLYKEGIIAERRYLETQSRHVEARATLAERRQTLQLAGMGTRAITQLEQNHKLSNTLPVRSPINGVVLESMANSGERVETNAPLYRVANLEHLWLEIRAPLADAHTLQPGAAIAIPGYNASAKLTVIGQNVSAENQTVLLRAEVTKGVENLHPGQFVEVSPVSGNGSQQFSIPSSALVRSGEQVIVFVQTDAGFRAQPVRLLSRLDDSAIIAGELRGDEQVAITGIAAIKAAWQGLGGGE